jgi:hypothetical protein
VRGARANILAELNIAGRSVWSEPVEVVLDGSPPRVFQPRLKPGPEFPQGTKELEVSVLTSDDELSGVAQVAAAFDLLETGSFPPDAKPVLAVPNATTGTWDLKLPAADFAPGTYRLLLRATDAVGNVGDYAMVTVRVLSAAPIPTDGKGEVRGHVTYRQEALAYAEVNLKAADGPEIRPARTDGGGNFAFSNVPPGKYKLSARAVIHNRPRIAEADLEVPAAPGTAKPVELQLR